jgi:hypothetical protein
VQTAFIPHCCLLKKLCGTCTQEVEAVRSTSQRGVCMVATAHGVDLQSLLSNPELVPLLGGKQTVILGDLGARQTNHGHKTRTERKGPPTFTAAVEVLAVDRCVDGMQDARAAAAHARLRLARHTWGFQTASAACGNGVLTIMPAVLASWGCGYGMHGTVCLKLEVAGICVQLSIGVQVISLTVGIHCPAPFLRHPTA